MDPNPNPNTPTNRPTNPWQWPTSLDRFTDGLLVCFVRTNIEPEGGGLAVSFERESTQSETVGGAL